MNLKEAKARLRIPEIWERLGMTGTCRRSSCHSPFYPAVSKASFSISQDGMLFRDFRTDESGDAITFLQMATGLSIEAACRKFLEMAGGQSNESWRHIRRPAPRPEQRAMPKFPSMEEGSKAELEQLAALRRVDVAACILAQRVNMLRFTKIWGHRAWVLTDPDGHNAQARRMDGKTWDHIPDAPKACTLPGSWASWPLGIRLGCECPIYLFVEGGPDLLAALHFIGRFGAHSTCYPVAMLGAGQRIHRDALPLFSGRRVRIFPHTDAAGQKAAGRWREELEPYASEIDVFSFDGLRREDGSLVKDLNDCTSIRSEDAAELEGMLS